MDSDELIWEKLLDDMNEIRVLGLFEDRFLEKIPLLDSQVKWNDFGVFLEKIRKTDLIYEK